MLFEGLNALRILLDLYHFAKTFYLLLCESLSSVFGRKLQQCPHAFKIIQSQVATVLIHTNIGSWEMSICNMFLLHIYFCYSAVFFSKWSFARWVWPSCFCWLFCWLLIGCSEKIVYKISIKKSFHDLHFRDLQFTKEIIAFQIGFFVFIHILARKIFRKNSAIETRFLEKHLKHSTDQTTLSVKSSDCTPNRKFCKWDILHSKSAFQTFTLVRHFAFQICIPDFQWNILHSR